MGFLEELLNSLKQQQGSPAMATPPFVPGQTQGFASAPFPSAVPQGNGLPPRNRSDLATPAPQMPQLSEVSVPERAGIFPEVQSQAGPKVNVDDELLFPRWQAENMNQPWHKDGDFMNELGGRLSNAFGSLTMRGNSPGAEKANMLKIAQAQQNRKNNKTIDYLIKNDPEKAKLLLGVPEEYRGKMLERLIDPTSGKQFRTEVSNLRVDEETGRMYYMESDGHGNQQIKFAEDDKGNPLFGDTAKAKQQRDIYSKGVDQALAAGARFFEDSEHLRKSTNTFMEARGALSRGARSGIIDSALPSLDENTARLRTLASEAGIGVINSATFGALSEKELKLAMSSGIPLNLGEDQLDAYLAAKIEAQEKLYREIEQKAQQLNSGDKTLSEWQAYWKEEARPDSYKDEYARIFDTDNMNTSYKGWRSEKDDDDQPKRKKSWEFAD